MNARVQKHEDKDPPNKYTSGKQREEIPAGLQGIVNIKLT